MGKPTAAFVLSLIGGLIYLIVGLIIVGASTIASSFTDIVALPEIGTLLAVVGGIGVLCGLIMAVGAVLMYSESKSRVRLGAVLVLVFALVGALFTVGGFVIGFILALVGSILGLVWKPQENMQTIPPPSTV